MGGSEGGSRRGPAIRMVEALAEAWRERVEGLEPWMIRWLEEQTDGPYWRHGSLRPDYGRIECPVMVIGGWADGYRNATLRLLEHLDAPCKVLMGPWSHRAAEASLPGPRIDWVPDMLRWWDRWLKGADNGVDREPPLSVFVRRSTRPEPDLDQVRGEWRFEPGWPLDRVQDRARSHIRALLARLVVLELVEAGDRGVADRRHGPRLVEHEVDEDRALILRRPDLRAASLAPRHANLVRDRALPCACLPGHRWPPLDGGSATTAEYRKGV